MKKLLSVILATTALSMAAAAPIVLVQPAYAATNPAALLAAQTRLANAAAVLRNPNATPAQKQAAVAEVAAALQDAKAAGATVAEMSAVAATATSTLTAAAAADSSLNAIVNATLVAVAADPTINMDAATRASVQTAAASVPGGSTAGATTPPPATQPQQPAGASPA